MNIKEGGRLVLRGSGNSTNPLHNATVEIVLQNSIKIRYDTGKQTWLTRHTVETAFVLKEELPTSDPNLLFREKHHERL